MLGYVFFATLKNLTQPTHQTKVDRQKGLKGILERVALASPETYEAKASRPKSTALFLLQISTGESLKAPPYAMDLKTTLAASKVFSISSSLCAAETKPASKADGAR